MAKPNNNRADRGKNRKAGNAPRISAEKQRDILAKQFNIKPKTKELVDMLLEDKTLTQTDAYMSLHPKASRKTAGRVASRVLNKPAVIGYSQAAVGKAKRRIITLVDSENESISLKAAQDVIDRNEGKAVQKNESTVRTVEVKLDFGQLRIGAHYVNPEQLPSPEVIA